MKKKILNICNTSFYLENFLKSYVESSLKDGYEMHVLCDLSDKNVNISNKVILHHITFPRSISISGFIRSIYLTYKLIKKNKYDLVISHNRNSSIVGRVATYFSNGPKNMYFAHGFYFHDDQNFISYYLTVQLERLLQKITTHTMSQSREDMEYMISKGYISKKNITYVGNGINNKKFRPIKNKLLMREKLGLPKKKYIITAIGRLVKGKGFQDLIKAINIHKQNEICLVIVGGNISQDISKFEQNIINLISSYNLSDKIILTGMVNNVEDYLAASDQFVLSSYREGVSRSMLEAMSCKIPVISSNIRGSREIIRNNLNGLLYQKKNVEELHSLIIKVKKSKKLREKIINNAYKLLNEFYTEPLYDDRQIQTVKRIFN